MEPSSHEAEGITSWQQPMPAHPQEREARRRAVAAGFVQLASPFVFCGMVLLGLVVEIPVTGDPHGYAQIFGFFFAVLMLIPGVALASIAIRLLRNSRRSGAVWLIVAASVSGLLFLGLASGLPGGIGELDWSRMLTIAVGVVGVAASGWCIWAAATALSRFPPG